MVGSDANTALLSFANNLQLHDVEVVSAASSDDEQPLQACALRSHSPSLVAARPTRKLYTKRTFGKSFMVTMQLL